MGVRLALPAVARKRHLGERVLDVLRVRSGVGLGDPIQASLDVLRADGLGELRLLASEALGCNFERRELGELSVVLPRPDELRVAKVPATWVAARP